MNRFWFSPGENRYVDGDDTVLITECPVALKTEEELLDASGQRIQGTGQADPLAAAFAADFTARYTEIASRRNIYTKLDTRLKATLAGSLFTQLQWVMDWDNTPAKGNERVDNLYLLTVGWTF